MEIGNKVILKSNGTKHTITDSLFSKKEGKDYYELDGNNIFSEDEIELAPCVKDNYEFKTEVLDNLVVVILSKNGEEISRGHGHIIHEGDVGVAQAASYALKRIYEKVGGTF